MFSDIVREILETRAEIYSALYAEKPEESPEEEATPVQDIDLVEHLKLQADIAQLAKKGKTNGCRLCLFAICVCFR